MIGNGVSPACLVQEFAVTEVGLEVDEVPILDEVPGNLVHTSSRNLGSNVVPRHPGFCLWVNIGYKEVPRAVNVRNTEITEIGSFP